MPIQIDLHGPEGNIFVIIGKAKNALNQLEKADITEGPVVEKLRDAVDNFKTSTYDETVEKLRSTELFKFIGGDVDSDSDDGDSSDDYYYGGEDDYYGYDDPADDDRKITV